MPIKNPGFPVELIWSWTSVCRAGKIPGRNMLFQSCLLRALDVPLITSRMKVRATRLNISKCAVQRYLLKLKVSGGKGESLFHFGFNWNLQFVHYLRSVENKTYKNNEVYYITQLTPPFPPRAMGTSHAKFNFIP